MPRDPYNYESWWAEIPPWMSPEELRAVRKQLGSSDEIIERHRLVEQLLEKEERREWRWMFLKQVLGAIAVSAGTLLTLKALSPPDWWPW